MKDRGELGVKTEYGIILRFKATDLKGFCLNVNPE